MKYENRRPVEGVNTTRVHPLKQFAQLLIGAVLLIIVLAFVLQISGSALAKKIPFSFEVAVMDKLDVEFGNPEEHPEIVAYLNELAQKLISRMPVPDGMDVVVHYSPEPVFNAFATVGGNLMFYQGLLSRMPDENTLAMVMAHEISHILHRDPVASLGGGVASTIALLGLTGSAGTGLAGNVLNSAGVLTSIQFTRKMEQAADEQAITAVNGLYGHVNGAAYLFELFSSKRGDGGSQPVWLERFTSTHPRDTDRIESIGERAMLEGWRTDGALTPLPAGFKSWL
jgi:predicted Zn-dependent protease